MVPEVDALPPGWIRERYSVDSAVAIVVWARYDGPHPASGDPPSRQAAANATRDVRPLVKIETTNIEVPVSSRTVRFRQAGTGDPSRPTRQPTQGTEERIVHDRYVERADLAALCPGIFSPEKTGTDKRRSRTGTTRSDALDKAIKAALATLRKRLKREPKTEEVVRYLEDDPTGTVVDSKPDALVWEGEDGRCHDIKRRTIANRLTKIRNQAQ